MTDIQTTIDRGRPISGGPGSRNTPRIPQVAVDDILSLQGSPVPLAGSRVNSASGQCRTGSRARSATGQRQVGLGLRVGSAGQSRPGSAVLSRPQTASPSTLEQYINSPPSETEDTHYLHDGTIIPLAPRSEPEGYVNTPNNLRLVEYAHNRSVTSFSEPARYAAARGFCVRSRSALIRETDGLVTSLCRQCCDVLGPKICHECAIIKRRDRDAKKYESFLPRVEITTENLTTTLLISRSFPDLPLEDIQKKITEGDISKPAFRMSVQRIREKRQKEAAKKAITSWKSKGKTLLASEPTYNFFKSVKDLNNKITQGQMARKIILTGDAEKDRTQTPKVRVAGGTSFSESVNPTFISPRKSAVVDREKRPITLYEPPLLPVVCQNVEPAFFAGKQSAYTLPPSKGSEPVAK